MTEHAWLWLVVGVVVAIAVGELMLWARGGVKATISRHTVAILYRWPVAGVLLGVAVGVLLGHLAWAQPMPDTAIFSQDTRDAGGSP